MVIIDSKKCLGCGRCVKDCVANNIVMENGTALAKKSCFLCGHCVAVCPVNAVFVPEYNMKEVKEYKKSEFALDPDVLLNAIKFRRSVRDYKNRPVEKEKLQKILEAGRFSATAKNNQDCHFVFIQEELSVAKDLVWQYIEDNIPEKTKDIPREFLPYVGFYRQRKANPEADFLFQNAPVVLFITSDWSVDPGLAAQNMELMAVSQGLGTLYNGFLAGIADKNAKLKKWLGIEGKTIKACMLIGYPNVIYSRTVPRKEANVIWK